MYLNKDHVQGGGSWKSPWLETVVSVFPAMFKFFQHNLTRNIPFISAKQDSWFWCVLLNMLQLHWGILSLVCISQLTIWKIWIRHKLCYWPKYQDVKKSQINSQFTAENRPKWPQKEAGSFPFTIHFWRGRCVFCWGGYLMFSEELKFHTSTNRLHCSLNSQLGLLKENETSGITERGDGNFSGENPVGIQWE